MYGNLRLLAEEVVDSAIGRDCTAFLDVDGIRSLLATASEARSRADVRDIHVLVRDAYSWANDRGWTTRNPTQRRAT
jgi:hypothetical protein